MSSKDYIPVLSELGEQEAVVDEIEKIYTEEQKKKGTAKAFCGGCKKELTRITEVRKPIHRRGIVVRPEGLFYESEGLATEEEIRFLCSNCGETLRGEGNIIKTYEELQKVLKNLGVIK